MGKKLNPEYRARCASRRTLPRCSFCGKRNAAGDHKHCKWQDPEFIKRMEFEEQEKIRKATEYHQRMILLEIEKNKRESIRAAIEDEQRQVAAGQLALF